MRPFAMRLGAMAIALAALAGCKEELYSGLTERDANQMIAALMDSGIPVSKREGAEGIDLMVDDARFAEAINVLTARGLPANQYQSMGDVFKKEGIVSSPVEERARYVYALSQELSETIGEIDGVLSARVHVVLPESDLLGRDLQPSSASVFIRHSGDASVGSFTAQIKNLVANSIEGLVYENVTVVSIPAGTATPGDGAEATRPMEQVLGVWVHPGSVRRLWMLVGASGGIVLVSLVGAGIVVMGRRGLSASALEEA